MKINKLLLFVCAFAWAQTVGAASSEDPRYTALKTCIHGLGYVPTQNSPDRSTWKVTFDMRGAGDRLEGLYELAASGPRQILLDGETKVGNQPGNGGWWYLRWYDEATKEIVGSANQGPLNIQSRTPAKVGETNFEKVVEAIGKIVKADQAKRRRTETFAGNPEFVEEMLYKDGTRNPDAKKYKAVFKECVDQLKWLEACRQVTVSSKEKTNDIQEAAAARMEMLGLLKKIVEKVPAARQKTGPQGGGAAR